MHRKRKALKLTHEELAEVLGVAPSTLSQWQTVGQIQQRSLHNLLRFFLEAEEVRKLLARRLTQ